MTWSASQYVKFEDERTRPARDLLSRVPLDVVQNGYDLGCGPGNSTELLVERYGCGVQGIDNDNDMLKAARDRLPQVTFTSGDVGTWRPSVPADLLFANAVFQWVPDHLDVLDSLMDGLVTGGALAVQMPDNLNEPSHLMMEETAQTRPWREIFAQKPARRAPLPPPRDYYERLSPKAAHLDIWHTVYNHPLDNATAIVEWVKGTGLRSYLNPLPPDMRDAFVADYAARVAKAYPAMQDGRVLLRFPRLFIVAIKK